MKTERICIDLLQLTESMKGTRENEKLIREIEKSFKRFLVLLLLLLISLTALVITIRLRSKYEASKEKYESVLINYFIQM